jgi:hypothetical protein
MSEIWKTIENYETYSVSTFGNVRNDKTGRILKGVPNTNGYLMVMLPNTKGYLIHRLVAFAFIPNPKNKEQVDHINNDISNNNLTNLRWATKFENGMNRKINIDNTSGFKGVCFHKRDKKWQSRIQFDGKNIHLGTFNTIEEAIAARKEKALELFGEFIHQCENI